MEVFFAGKVVLHPGDCLDVMSTLAANSIDACVTDPPYGIGFMGRGWDTFSPAGVAKRVEQKRRKSTSPPQGHGALNSRGFVEYDFSLAGEHRFQAWCLEWAREVFRVLKPGAHLLSFGGTRTYHRMACAIEDAGFEIRDSLQWLYGSGFPKSLDVSKAIDKAAGVKGEFGERKPNVHSRGDHVLHEGWRRPWMDDPEAVNNSGREYIPGSDEAVQWSGWGTALKPACEPIVLARKPLSEKTVAANVLKWGTGAINIDACRVLTGDKISPRGSMDAQTNIHDGWSRPWMQDKAKSDARLATAIDKAETLGRWPANVIHDGSDEVVGAFPDVTTHGGGTSSTGFWQRDNRRQPIADGDSGSAARFFKTIAREELCDLCRWPYEPNHDTDFSCNANTAEKISPTESTPTGAIAHNDVAASPLRASADSEPLSSDRVRNAESPSRQIHQPKVDTAPKSVPDSEASRIAQNARSAASLCNSCATAFAHAFVAVRHNQTPEDHLSQVSITEHRKRILFRNLALHVAGRENTDIITTTESLKILFGSVLHAIADITKSERNEALANIDSGPRRLHYSSKADFDDRLGSRHPTVKPVALISYLVKLVCPKSGLVLDCFAGTGTTGEAAFREGMRAILIEREEEYQNDIRRRMSLVMSGSDERARESIKAKTKDKPVDHGPLFGPAPAKQEVLGI